MKNISIYLKEITQAEYHRVDKKLEKYNLVKGQATLLSIIRDNNGATQNELAHILNVKYPSMSERLNKLEALGYIEKGIDEDNQRYKRVCITPSGRKAVTQANKMLNEFDEKLYKGFTKKDKKQLEEYLEKMLFNITKQDN
jgi:DNA-binding MarR family transcriptional regulator